MGEGLWVSDLQQHFPTVDAHRVHGAEGHEGDGDRRGRVHSVVVTERSRDGNLGARLPPRESRRNEKDPHPELT